MKKEDLELIEAAKIAFKKLYHSPNHTVAAAVRAKDGTIYTGVNTHHFTGGVCGETAALVSAFNDGQKDIRSVVSVGLNDEKIEVINPCGKCRQIFHDYCPQTTFLINDGKKVIKLNLHEIVPYDWFNERYREKT